MRMHHSDRIATDDKTQVVGLYVATRKVSLSVPPKTRGYTAALSSLILIITL